MHRLLIVGILMLFVLSCVCAGVNKPAPKPVQSAWRMQVPAGWQQLKPDDPCAILMVYDAKHLDRVENLLVAHFPARGRTLDQVFKDQQPPKGVESYKILSHGKAEVGGLSALYIVDSSTQPGMGPMKAKSFCVIRKGYLYIFGFSCRANHFAECSKDFASIIGSVKWVDPPKA